jgi:tetratricopeptide (TPR) repeat protein
LPREVLTLRVHRISSQSIALPKSNRLGLTVSVCVFLVAVIWIVFGQTLGHDFVNYDDQNYVYENPKITGGLNLASIAWAFGHVHAQNWHPLTTISHMLDCQLYGLKPGGHHFTNVLLHTVAVLLLFAVLRRMTGALWRSAFVAAVFAIHPLHVESVAWVAERKDVLSAVFFMLTLNAYVCYARAPSIARYLTVAALFVLGLMSKPMLVTLPFILLVLDYWPLKRFAPATSVTSKANWLNWWERQSPLRRPILEKIPLLALSAISSTVTFLVQREALGWTEDLRVSSRFNNAVVSYIAYIWQMLRPVKLAVFYPHPENRLPPWEIILSLVALIAITVIAIVLRRKRPYIVVGWLWYLGMLVPVIGLVQVGWQGRADRYTYLPQIGLYVMITWAIAELSVSWRHQRQIAAFGAAIILGALAWRAWNQASFWLNSETLWTHTLAVTSKNDVAENNLGIIFLGRGQVDPAISRFQAAVDIRPANAAAHDNLAKAFLQKGRVSDAMVQYRKMLEIQPGNVEAHNILGTVLIQQGRVSEAIEQWREALAIQPENGNAKSNLAWVFATDPEQSFRNGPEAVQLAEQALQLSGGKNPIILRTLAAAYAETGEFSNAIQTAQQGVELANSLGNSRLATELQGNIAIYQEQRPLRDFSLTHGNSPPRNE